MLGESDDAPWIPIEALPVDLQAQCARTGADRHHAEARVDQIPGRLVLLGCIVFVLGVLFALLPTRIPAFGSAYRVGLLATGLAFMGGWLALRRTRRFLSAGGQRLVIGPTCLVVVDAEAVRVLPAEWITIQSRNVLFTGKIINEGGHLPSWWADLERAQKAASDPAGQEADRFRAAAAQARPWTARRVRWRRRAPVLVAGLTGVLLALILEVGPIHARAEGKIAAATAAAARAHSFKTQVDEIVSAREAFVASLASDMDSTAKRAARDKVLAVAASGKEDDLRTFLRNAEANDPARLDIVEQLRKLCTARLPTKGLLGMDRLTRLLEGVACASEAGTTFRFTYNDPGSEITPASAQRVANDLAWKLHRGVTAKLILSAPKNEPYLELKLSKEGPSLGGMMRVRVIAIVHNARSVAPESYTYSISISTTDPSTAADPQSPTFRGGQEDAEPIAPTPRTPSTQSTPSTPDPPSGSDPVCRLGVGVACGYGAGAWCCYYGTQCGTRGQCIR